MPITQGIQGWVGQVFEQPDLVNDLVKDGFAHGREGEVDFWTR